LLAVRRVSWDQHVERDLRYGDGYEYARRSRRAGHRRGRADALGERGQSPARLPLVVYVLAVGAFLMPTTEFVVAGLLPEISGDLRVSVPQAGLLITVFAAGHLIVAVGSSFALPLTARFVAALATGAFWAGIENGWLKPRISRVLPRADAAEAHRLLGERQTIGKILLSTGN
jgi:hypothetical protein